MGSLLTDSRIDLTFHSATARMSEGNAGANEALRVEFSTFLKLYRGAPRKLGELSFLESLLQALLGEAPHKPRELASGKVYLKLYQESSAQTPGKTEPIFTRPRVLRFRLRAARLLIASRPDAPLRGLNVGLCGDR